MAKRVTIPKPNRRPFGLLAVLAASVWACGTIAYAVSAWFATENAATGSLDYGTFALSGLVAFDGAPAAAEGGLVAVNVTDPESPSYIGRLSVDLTYRGTGRYCLRVLVVEMWERDGVILRQPVTVYRFDAAAWYDARRQDGYFYLAGEEGSARALTVLSGSGEETALRLLTGPDDLPLQSEGVTMQLFVRAEAVQFNRCREVWGVESFPWEAAA